MRRGFKGVWIPAEVWLHPKMKMVEKVLLAEIDSLDNENGCFASNVYLSRFIGVSVPTITRGLATLKELGYVYVETFDGRKRVLRTTTEWKKRRGGPVNKNRLSNQIDQALTCSVDEYTYNSIDNEHASNDAPEPKQRRKLPVLDDLPADILAEAESRIMSRNPKPKHGSPAWKDMIRVEAAQLLDEQARG